MNIGLRFSQPQSELIIQKLLLHSLSNEQYKLSPICFALIAKLTSLHSPKKSLCHFLPLMSHTLGAPLITSPEAPNDSVMLQFADGMNLGHSRYSVTHPCYMISKAHTILVYIFCKYQSTSSMLTFSVPNLKKPNAKFYILCVMIQLPSKKFSREMWLSICHCCLMG